MHLLALSDIKQEELINISESLGVVQIEKESKKNSYKMLLWK